MWYWHSFSLLVTSYLSLPWMKYTTWWKDPRLDNSTFYGGGSSLNSKPEKSVPFLPGHLDPFLKINKSQPNKIMLVFLSLNIYLLSSFIIGTFEILYRIITVALYIYITFSPPGNTEHSGVLCTSLSVFVPPFGPRRNTLLPNSLHMVPLLYER